MLLPIQIFNTQGHEKRTLNIVVKFGIRSVIRTTVLSTVAPVYGRRFAGLALISSLVLVKGVRSL